MDADSAENVDVLVVGAGPSGLMAGLCLARLGVSAVVIDGKSGPTRESRALALQARTMELYDQVGVVDRVLARALRSPRIVPGYGRRRFASLSFADFGRELTPYPGIHILEQSANEEILAEAFAEAGGDVRWGHTLEGLDADAGGTHPVAASARSASGLHSIRARWCIGADGASSAVRERLGVGFEGSTNPLTFFVSDAEGVRGLVPDAINLRFAADYFMLAFPMGRGRHRLLGVVPEESGDFEAQVRRRLASRFGITYESSNWVSQYRVHHRVADTFRVGHVFLVGDAAHVHSPVGAQGMNTGLQDAHNLACKLADVLVRGAASGTLARYEAERRPVARRLVRTTDAAFARITSESRLGVVVRSRILPVLGPVIVPLLPRLIGTERAYGYLAQLRIHYWMSDALKRRRRGRRARIVGRRLAWSGHNHEALRSLSWQVHAYSDKVRAEEVGRELGVEAFTFPPDGFGRLRDDVLYLVRPDGFVAAAARPADAVHAFASTLPWVAGVRVRARPE